MKHETQIAHYIRYHIIIPVRRLKEIIVGPHIAAAHKALKDLGESKGFEFIDLDVQASLIDATVVVPPTYSAHDTVVAFKKALNPVLKPLVKGAVFNKHWMASTEAVCEHDLNKFLARLPY